MKKKQPQKSWTRMTAAELGEATRRFDAPVSFQQTRAMTPAQRARWNRNKRLAAVARSGLQGSQVREVKIQLSESLLKQCNDYAARHALTVSDVVNLVLRSTFQFAD